MMKWLFLLLCWQVLATEKFEYETPQWQGPYSNRDFNHQIKSSSPGEVSIDVTYLDAAYTVDKYQLTLDDHFNIIITRYDKPKTGQRHKMPYQLKGKISGLAGGKYQVKINRQLRNGKYHEILKDTVKVK